jgi:hypothetical protein
MKKPFLLLILLIWGFTISYAQTTIYTANNNPGAVTGPNIFTGTTAFADAYSAATAGDIIYVIPSATNYGKMTLDKSGISIFGIGFYPDKTPTLLTHFTELDITNGASDSRISGITFSLGGNSLNQVRTIDFINTNEVTNIIIDKCRFQSLGSTGAGNVANLVIQNNIIDRSSNHQFNVIQTNSTWSNVRIAHNIIYGDDDANGSQGFIDDLIGGLIEHNLFVGENTSSAQNAFHDVHLTTIRNNIFYRVQPRFSGGFSNNQFSHNISFGAASSSFQGGNGNTFDTNQTNVDPAIIAISMGFSYNFSNNPNVDQLTSPAVGTAEDGTEVGLFGGAAPFDTTGTPFPIVQSITVAPNISQGSIMNVRIKAKGN